MTCCLSLFVAQNNAEQNPLPPCASGALDLPSSAFGSAVYLNMSFNGALGGTIPASLASSGIFNAQVRCKSRALRCKTSITVSRPRSVL